MALRRSAATRPACARLVQAVRGGPAQRMQRLSAPLAANRLDELPSRSPPECRRQVRAGMGSDRLLSGQRALNGARNNFTLRRRQAAREHTRWRSSDAWRTCPCPCRSGSRTTKSTIGPILSHRPSSEK
eukprot:scaffold133183_cov30-Tisochrysis_lutea.AAC.6